jgi:phosphohistidine phosphatase
VKRLTLMRHGNAKWKDPEVTDFERPLNRRGSVEAEAMARRMAELKFVPALIIASPAQRTRQTADIVARELGVPFRQVRTDESLYLARADDMLKVIRATGPRVPHLMIVGHNPGLSRLADQLGAQYDGDDLATGAVCSMTFDSRNWSTVEASVLRESMCEAPPSRLFSSLWG